MRFFQPIMLVCAVAMSFVGAHANRPNGSLAHK